MDIVIINKLNIYQVPFNDKKYVDDNFTYFYVYFMQWLIKDISKYKFLILNEVHHKKIHLKLLGNITYL